MTPRATLLRQGRRSFKSATAVNPLVIRPHDPQPLGALALPFGPGGEAVDDVKLYTRESRRHELQSGHGGEAVDDATPPPAARGTNGLQFGHGGEAVDDCGPIPAKMSVLGLQFGHGGEAVDDTS